MVGELGRGLLGIEVGRVGMVGIGGGGEADD